ncbi:MAG: hypothetical protein ACK56I_06115, partial [bacterium]
CEAQLAAFGHAQHRIGILDVREVEELEEAVEGHSTEFIRRHLPRPQNTATELLREPLHLRRIVATLAGDDQILAWKGLRKAIQHAGGSTDHVLAQRGIRFIQPRGETDAAGQRIELGNAHALLG